MNVALLVCEDIPAYERLFRDLFDKAPEGAEITLHPFNVYEGRLPVTVHDYAAYLITGSYAGAYEDLPWIAPLLDFVRRAHAVRIPLVGVCFGHQILAQALNGRVEKAKVGWGLGVHATRITQRFSWMEGTEQTNELQLIYVHQDQVTTAPPNATVFMTTELCPVAGFVVGDATTGETALGIQGHPEFTPAVVEKTIRSQPEKFPSSIADPALASLASPDESRDSGTVSRWIVRFLLNTRGPEIDRFEAFLGTSFPRGGPDRSGGGTAGDRGTGVSVEDGHGPGGSTGDADQRPRNADGSSSR